MSTRKVIGVDRETLCNLFAVSDTSIRRWLKRNDFPSDAVLQGGRYDLGKIIRWKIAEAEGNDVESEIKQHKRDYIRERAARERLVVGELRGKLVDADQVIDELRFVNTVKRQALLSWSKRLPGALEGKNFKAIARIIDREIRHILTEYSKGTRNLIELILKEKLDREIKTGDKGEQYSEEETPTDE